MMSTSVVKKIVDAVLYEGYILYPYRPFAKKNRRQSIFGRIYPQSYSTFQKGEEPCEMQTQCLVQKYSATVTLEVSVHFLHPIWRKIGRISKSLSGFAELPDEAEFQIVPELDVGGDRYETWQEATEREVKFPSVQLVSLSPHSQTIPFSFSSPRPLNPIRDERNSIVGVILRLQQTLEGEIELLAEPLDENVFKVTVRIRNHTPMSREEMNDQDNAIMKAFASTHTILHVGGGEFLSSLDPPENYERESQTCMNTGTWPVLVGEESKGGRDTMLSSPVILSDYPKIAPERLGDFFDEGEIDEMLSLRIMTLTDDENRYMAR
jgi:hypothetical protein